MLKQAPGQTIKQGIKFPVASARMRWKLRCLSSVHPHDGLVRICLGVSENKGYLFGGPHK